MLEQLLPAYFEWWHLLVLLLVGFIAEAYGTLFGGGSILMIPMLTALGIPLQTAVAMDNAAAIGTEAGIVSETQEKIKQHKRLIAWMFVPLALGGVIGTYLLLSAPVEFIKYLMIAAALYLLVHTYFVKPRLRPHAFDRWKYPLLFVVMLIIGLYNNYIGVAEGTFSKIAIMTILGLSFMESHGLKTIAMVPIRLYSLVVTAIAGLIIWPYLFTLWIATFAAGKYATKSIKRVPEGYLKTALTVTSLGFIGYLIFIY
jgi:uncharacterized membrane protein YfcA